MSKTMVLLKPVHTHVGGKRVSLKKAASKVKFNLATMIALAEGTGVPIDVLLNEALNDFINVTGRHLAAHCNLSKKEWEDRSKYPPAEPGALGCEPLKAACAGSLTRPRLS